MEEIKLTTDISETVKTMADSETGKEFDKTAAILPRVVHAALAPLEKWVMYREYSIEATRKILERKLSAVPIENIITPPAYIAVPALQSISYCMDNDELRDMYAELLAHAMNKEEVLNVHPTYVEIIKQMSPYDAVVFKKLCGVLVKPCISIQYKNMETGAAYPVQDIIAFEDIEEYPVVPTQIALENLERLKLIDINKRSKYGNEESYFVLKHGTKRIVDDFLKDNKDQFDNKYEIVYDEFVIMIRGFGQFFARACLGEKFENIR